MCWYIMIIVCIIILLLSRDFYKIILWNVLKCFLASDSVEILHKEDSSILIKRRRY